MVWGVLFADYKGASVSTALRSKLRRRFPLLISSIICNLACIINSISSGIFASTRSAFSYRHVAFLSARLRY